MNILNLLAMIGIFIVTALISYGIIVSCALVAKTTAVCLVVGAGIKLISMAWTNATAGSWI